MQKAVIQLAVPDKKLMQLPSFEYQLKNGNLDEDFNLTNWRCPEEVTVTMENRFWEVKEIQMKKKLGGLTNSRAMCLCISSSCTPMHFLCT